MKENNKVIPPIVEIQTVMIYDGEDVKIKKLITNEMPAMLTFALVKALNDTIKDYYDKEKR